MRQFPIGKDKLGKWLETQVRLPEVKTRALNAFQVFTDLIDASDCKFVFNNPERLTMAPVEIVYSVALVDLFNTKAPDIPLVSLAKHINAMRILTRNEHKDIRANDGVTKTLAGFVTKIVEGGEEWATAAVRHVEIQRSMKTEVGNGTLKRQRNPPPVKREVKREPLGSDGEFSADRDEEEGTPPLKKPRTGLSDVPS